MKDLVWTYAEDLTSAEDEILYNLRRETYLTTLYPRMLSGPIQGKLLEILVKVKQARRVLELGTFTGYSAICMARGLSEDGRLVTVEINDELEDIIRKYVHLAGLEQKIEVIFGDAIEVVPHLEEKFDFVFIDADKSHYLDYYKMVFPKVEVGGLIVVDNIFWNLKIFEQFSDKYTRGVREFNEYIRSDERVERVVLPMRDGLMLLYKKFD